MASYKRIGLVGGSAVALIVGSSCTDAIDPLAQAPDSAVALNFEHDAEQFDFGNALSFNPLPTSAACVAGGGLEQMTLPAGYVATLVDAEPHFLDNIDMNTVNETGPQAGRYLFRTHENTTNAGVSVTDLATGVSRVIAQHADWERFDGIAWTPWGTLLAGEEAAGGAGFLPDPTFPSAVKGLVYEIDPWTGQSTPRPALGSKSHEGIRFDQEGNIYGISENFPGYIFKFVPDHYRDLTKGKMYALKIVEDQGDRTGWAQWVLLDAAQVAIDADAAAAAKGATGYNRPEDLETANSTGNDGRGSSMLYAAITSENRVLAIDLKAGRGQRKGQVLVSDYVRNGVNAPIDFTFPDNLALDNDGNLFITEDPGGSAPSKTLGDDIWVARFDRGSQSHATSVSRFLSITDCNAEPTGVYFSKSNRSLFVDIQHRGGDGRDGAYAIQKIAKVNFNVIPAENQ